MMFPARILPSWSALRGNASGCAAVRTLSTTTTQQRPNRLTQAYNEMQQQLCPDTLAAYADCVQSHSDDLLQGRCQREFDAVNECFRQTSARRRTLGRRREKQL